MGASYIFFMAIRNAHRVTDVNVRQGDANGWSLDGVHLDLVLSVGLTRSL
jgi:hypothetical protein